MKFTRRAEASERSQLVETFVDAGPLFTLLSSVDHQIMYGRRGTGKTHALSYLVETKVLASEIAAYVDMRTVGSSGGIYADRSIPVPQRATRLLIDTLSAIHDQLLTFAIENSEEVDLSRGGPILDQLADAVSEVKVLGETSRTVTSSAERAEASTTSFGVGISSSGFTSELGTGSSVGQTASSSSEVVESGTATHRVQFGFVQQALTAFAGLVSPRRIWIVLDEWSDVPLDLQPYLADLLRRCIFPVQGITVKIGAIEHRSLFRVSTTAGDYIGIELGADAAADLNLDDFMVFDNDSERAKVFFREFLYKHFRAVVNSDEREMPRSPSHLVSQGFTQRNAFDEFVRATEGVPRDAINIIILAAQRAFNEPISVQHVRAAASTWYQRDKQPAVNSTFGAIDLLAWIIDKVIGERRTRAFLLPSNARHPLIDSLFDARVLHLLKRSIAAHDQPGVRYDVFKLDYGCYVDLINTARAPAGLLPYDNERGEEGGFIEVPPDDYRSIRRAILNLEEFDRERPEAPNHA